MEVLTVPTEMTVRVASFVPALDSALSAREDMRVAHEASARATRLRRHAASRRPPHLLALRPDGLRGVRAPHAARAARGARAARQARRREPRGRAGQAQGGGARARLPRQA